MYRINSRKTLPKAWMWEVQAYSVEALLWLSGLILKFIFFFPITTHLPNRLISTAIWEKTTTWKSKLFQVYDFIPKQKYKTWESSRDSHKGNLLVKQREEIYQEGTSVFQCYFWGDCNPQDYYYLLFLTRASTRRLRPYFWTQIWVWCNWTPATESP